MKKSRDLVQCVHCGWVHFPVSLPYASEEVRLFNEYFDALPREKQIELYGGTGSSLSSYENCFGCGKPADMSYEITRDVFGKTIQPIIWEK